MVLLFLGPASYAFPMADVQDICPDCLKPIEFRITQLGRIGRFQIGTKFPHICKPADNHRFHASNVDVFKQQDGDRRAGADLARKETKKFTRHKARAWKELREQ